MQGFVMGRQNFERVVAPRDAAGALAQGARADEVQRDRDALALGLDCIQTPQVHLRVG